MASKDGFGRVFLTHGYQATAKPGSPSKPPAQFPQNVVSGVQPPKKAS